MFHMKENKKKRSILFISHDASLTGAPILLLNLINIFNKEKEYNINILIKNGEGPLLEKFKNSGNCIILKRDSKSNFYKILKKLIKIYFFKNLTEVKVQKLINETDIIFSNTITNGDFFKKFNFDDRSKIITYVHELELATRFYTTSTNLKFVLDMTTHFLVPSRAVAYHLNKNLKIDIKKIDYLNYFIPEIPLAPNHKEPNSHFIVGLAGTLDWRKGADILCIVVLNFFKKYPNLNVKFVWKGVNESMVEFDRITIELEKAGVAQKVLLESATQNMEDFYQNIDVFLLLSKEDPFPLVVLEAASASKPCICFSEAGGASEFVQNDAGDVVPYLDIQELSTVIFSYYKDREMLKLKGETANLKLKKMHQNEHLILDQLSQILAKI